MKTVSWPIDLVSAVFIFNLLSCCLKAITNAWTNFISSFRTRTNLSMVRSSSLRLLPNPVKNIYFCKLLDNFEAIRFLTRCINNSKNRHRLISQIMSSVLTSIFCHRSISTVQTVNLSSQKLVKCILVKF